MTSPSIDPVPGLLDKIANNVLMLSVARAMQVFGVPVALWLLASVWSTVSATHDATLQLTTRQDDVEHRLERVETALWQRSGEAAARRGDGKN